MPRSHDQQVGRLGCGYQKPASFKSVPHQRTEVSPGPLLGWALPWFCPSFYLSIAHNCHPPLLPSSLTHPSTLDGFSAIKEGAATTSLPPSEGEETESFEVTYPCYVTRAVEPGYEPGSRALKTVLLAAWRAYVVSDTRLASSLTHPPDTQVRS